MKGKFTSVILAVVLVVITVGTVFFGYSKASGKAAKSSVEGEQRYAWPLATYFCNTVCKRSREIKRRQDEN